MLVSFADSQKLGSKGTVEAEDSMDDGSPIRLAVTIDAEQRTAHFDFTGTGPEVFANTNAPPAVTYSAIIYAMRCMVKDEIPLNQVRNYHPHALTSCDPAPVTRSDRLVWPELPCAPSWDDGCYQRLSCN